MTITEFPFSFLTLEDHGDAVVVRITRSQLSEEENIAVFGNELVSLVEQCGCRKIVLSLQDVAYITSAALGKLITLHRRLHRKDGQLVICCAMPAVHEVLETSRLQEYFTVVADVDAALSRMAAG